MIIDIRMNKKPEIVFKKIIKPFHSSVCFKCKRKIRPLRKKAFIGVKFPGKILGYFLCMKCYKKKYG